MKLHRLDICIRFIRTTLTRESTMEINETNYGIEISPVRFNFRFINWSLSLIIKDLEGVGGGVEEKEEGFIGEGTDKISTSLESRVLYRASAC